MYRLSKKSAPWMTRLRCMSTELNNQLTKLVFYHYAAKPHLFELWNFKETMLLTDSANEMGKLVTSSMFLPHEREAAMKEFMLLWVKVQIFVSIFGTLLAICQFRVPMERRE